MGADERLFTSQMLAFPTIRVPPWIPPRPYESLRNYSTRFAKSLNPGGPCIIGGASFGGMLALEMVPHLNASACLLIGSVQSHTEIPLHWRAMEPLAYLGPGWLRVGALLGRRVSKQLFSVRTRRRLDILSRSDESFARWGLCAAVRWRRSRWVHPTRVYHIHGSDDHILPVNLTNPDTIVPGGAHALSLFNPAAVNDYIANLLREVTANRR
jgi:pimeloyl-ACP methyl ester carboxylesterase